MNLSEVIKKRGVSFLVHKAMLYRSQEHIYEKYIKNERPADIRKLKYNPLISLAIFPLKYDKESVDVSVSSVLEQSYKNFELLLMLPDSEKYSCPDKRVKTFHPKTENIYNDALMSAKGDYVMIILAGDTISKDALYYFAERLNSISADMVYSDEDRLSAEGQRTNPDFKPDWSPDTLLSYMYIGRGCIFNRHLLSKIGIISTVLGKATYYDTLLRFTELTDKIEHVPLPLYHIGANNADHVPNDEEMRMVKQMHIDRLKMAARVDRKTNSIVYDNNNELVSIIIPSKDNPKMLESCINGLLEKTDYSNIEIIVVDNGSTNDNRALYSSILSFMDNAKYIYKDMAFNFSSMCNIGAAAASGKYLLFLNDDIEIREVSWLKRMLGQARQKNTGAVSAKLYYPASKRIQHCGIINIKNGPVLTFMGADEAVIKSFRAKRVYNCLAVTGACLMISKDKFYAVRGFDERLPVSYNDIDLCFKLHEAGYYNVVRNDAFLWHHESASRGNDMISKVKLERLAKERSRLYFFHPDLFAKDPFYNPNLSQRRADCRLNDSFNDYLQKADRDEIFKLNGKVNAHFDSYNTACGIALKGMAEFTNAAMNGDVDAFVVLFNQKECYLYGCDCIYNQDLPKAKAFRGIDARINHADLPKGSFRVGILLKNNLTGAKGCILTDEMYTKEL